MPAQYPLKILHRYIVVKVVKALERYLVLWIGGPECGLGKRIGCRANCARNQEQKRGAGNEDGEAMVPRVVRSS